MSSYEGLNERKGGENTKELETRWDLTVKAVREAHELKEDKDGNLVAKAVHTAILANEDGVKFAISRDTPLPWDVKDPVTVRIVGTQTRLET